MEDSNEKVFGILAYFGILWLIPLLAGNTQFSKFHANQGIILFIFDIIIGIVAGVFAVIPFAGWVVAGIIGGIGGLALFILAIMGIVNAANGQMKPVPVLGNLFTIVK